MNEGTTANRLPTLPELCTKTAVAHTITYMFMGILASTFLNYKEAFARPEMICWMRQFDDPILRAGVLFQPIRGVVFALAFYPLREILFGREKGWLVLSWLLVALGILCTFGPAPGSLEGMIFTRITHQYLGYLEVVPQAILLSVIVYYWVNRREKKWLTWTLAVLFVITVLLGILGVVIPTPQKAG